jgi:uncharacterized repeat protein (TIGR03803 family)
MLRTRYSASSFRLLCPCYDPNDRLLRFILIGLTAVFLVQYSQAQTESVLYNFKGGTTDGSSPYAGLLLDQHGNLFGTTGKGGIYSNSGHGGIAFELSPAGPRYAEKILYNFGGVIDGYQPLSGLVEDSSGNLYGTAYYGGGAGCGTFYKITPGISWTETGLFDFPCSWPGQWPVDAGKLAVDSSGNFYGTTFEGGYSGQGMVFKMTVTLDGITDQLIYSFDRTQDYLDGTYPDASVIMDAEGNLYGTTHGGGVAGWGTVFELSPNDNGTWNETIIHSFLNSPSDGAAPYANLVMDQYGNLFGTTTGGGMNYFRTGTAFGQNWSFTVLDILLTARRHIAALSLIRIVIFTARPLAEVLLMLARYTSYRRLEDCSGRSQCFIALREALLTAQLPTVD